ncbi:hypothetical protein AB5I41_10060 [Sphingomonas sp. MMS24-JH45]
MRATFIASGPAFATGRTLGDDRFQQSHVAPLLRDILGLPAGTGVDGSDRPFRDVLKR